MKGFDGRKIDKALVDRIYSSSDDSIKQQAFAALFERHKEFVYKFLSSTYPKDADDLFQETWLHLMRDGYEELTYKGKSKFTTWLALVIKTRIVGDYFGIQEAKVKLKLKDFLPVDIRTQTLRHLFINLIIPSVKVYPVGKRTKYISGIDYKIEKDNLQIRRVENSSIQNGAEVEVRYRYIFPRGTTFSELQERLATGRRELKEKEEGELRLPLSSVLSEQVEDTLEKIIQKMDTEEKIKILRGCMDELSKREKEEIDRPKYYRVIFLTFFEGAANKDIANFLGIKRRTKDTWLHRAKKILLSCFISKYYRR